MTLGRQRCIRVGWRLRGHLVVLSIVAMYDLRVITTIGGLYFFTQLSPHIASESCSTSRCMCMMEAGVV